MKLADVVHPLQLKLSDEPAFVRYVRLTSVCDFSLGIGEGFPVLQSQDPSQVVRVLHAQVVELLHQVMSVLQIRRVKCDFRHRRTSDSGEEVLKESPCR